MKIILAFTTGILVANTNIDPTIWKMSAIAFGIALLSGALHQADLKIKKTLVEYICACLFSGLAGFITYAFTREMIHDPLLLVVQFIFAGLVGADLVKRLASEWFKK